jgi:uncharacterized delta-60 repeat protein
VTAALDDVSALALRGDGRLVAAGGSNLGSATLFSLVRYKRNGTPDLSFGKGGKVMTAVGEYGGGIAALDLQRGGKLVAAGFTAEGSLLVRYRRNGTLDPSFGQGGKVTIASDPVAFDPMALETQANGKLTLAGDSLPPGYAGTNMIALARFNRNGTRDQSFGKGGFVLTPMGPRYGNGSKAYSLVIQPDGKLVAAGYSDSGSQTVFTLVRYEPSGNLERSFGNGGIVTTAIRSCCDQTRALVLQPDGNLVAAGSSSIDNDRGPIALARYVP